jgi:spermidine/putrescine transport system substrate-binding protein
MKKPIVEMLREGRLSRRDFHRALAAAGLSVAALPLVPSTARAEPKITVFTWSGYDSPEFMPKYVAKHGEPPQFALFEAEEEALQKMIGGYAVDVIHPCSYNIKRWKDAGIIQPIDTTRLSEYGNIWDRLRSLPATSFDGKAYFVPFDIGTSAILYRPDLVDPADVAEPSWSLLFNEKYKGRLSMYDTDTTFIEIAARVLGLYEDYLHLSDEQLAKIKPLLSKQRDLMRFYWADQTQLEQAVASGEIAAAYAWNGSYKRLRDQGVDVRYVTPKEGLLGYCCGLVRHAKAPGDEQAAYDFLDAMIDPEVGKVLMEQEGYLHSNKRSYDLADPAVVESLGAKDPAATMAALTIDPEPEEPYRSTYIKLVNDVKSGL